MEEKDTWWQITLQVFPLYVLGGCGLVAAGLILNQLSMWPAIFNIPAIILIIPPMIVLQENMQMTLAARLSTAANLGHLDRRTQATNTLAGNIMLVQCQAIIFGFLVFLCSLAQNSLLVSEDQIYKNLSYEETILMCSTILITASLGNFLISLKVFLCVIIGRKCCCNPDNIAVPLAVGENQIILIVLVGWVSDYLYHTAHGFIINHVVIGLYIILVIIFLVLTNRNSHVSKVLKVGWVPLMVSSIIAEGAGWILYLALWSWRGLALLYPIIGSTGVYLVGIHSSRLTTYLNKTTVGHLGTLPEGEEKICRSPVTILCGKPHALSVKVLLCLLVPAQILFIILPVFVKEDNLPSLLFIFLILLASFLQVTILLYLCSLITYFLWYRRTDPDNAAIPYLNAIGELLGICLLAATFAILNSLGDQSLEYLYPRDIPWDGHMSAVNATSV